MPQDNLKLEFNTVTNSFALQYIDYYDNEKQYNIELLFSIVTQESLQMNTDITDHLVEDNTYIQDHIAIKPVTYTIKGLVSEKTFMTPAEKTFTLPKENWKSKLTKIGVLVPTLTSYAQSAINVYEKIVNTANKIKSTVQNVYNIFKRTVTGGKITVSQTSKKWSNWYIQEGVIEVLNYCRVNRIPVVIAESGWHKRIGNNFYITNVEVTQGNTHQQSDLSITLKELRFAHTEVRAFNKEDYKRLAYQDQQTTELGKLQGKKELTSKLYNITHGEKQ